MEHVDNNCLLLCLYVPHDLYLHSLSRLQMRPSSFRLETRQVLVPVPSEYWISKMASLYYILIVSNCSALFTVLKSNNGSISSFVADHSELGKKNHQEVN